MLFVRSFIVSSTYRCVQKMGVLTKKYGFFNLRNLLDHVSQLYGINFNLTFVEVAKVFYNLIGIHRR